MTQPEPTVLPTRYVVSCLPEDHDNRYWYTIRVEYGGHGQYAVRHNQMHYGTNGAWEHEPHWPEHGIDEDMVWLAAHRFDHDTALRLARELAPTLTYRGRSVADALAAVPAVVPAANEDGNQ